MPPVGAVIRHPLVIDPLTPTTLYAAGASGSAFKSIDGGASWTPMPALAGVVEVLAIDPQTPTTLYAATLGGGVFKSVDGGGNWAPLQAAPSRSVVVLAIDPQTPTTLYAATNGIFKSVDGGEDWTPMNAGLVCRDEEQCLVRQVVIDPVAPATLYASTDVGVFKSTDGGGTWGPRNAGLTSAVYAGGFNVASSLAIDPRTPTTLYAGTQDGVFKSTDGGGTWAPRNGSLPNVRPTALVMDPQPPMTLYAATERGVVFKSPDGGGSWTPIANLPVLDLAIDPQTSTTLYAAADGVYKSVDGGGSWTPRNVGLVCVEAPCPVRSLAIDPLTPTTLYAWSSALTTSLFRSTDGGESWTPMSFDIGLLGHLVIDPQTPTTLYAGLWGGVAKSMDGGQSWTLMNAGLSGVTGPVALAIDPRTPTTLYAGAATGRPGVFKSTDGGGNWTPMNAGLVCSGKEPCSVYQLVIDPLTPTTLYAGTDGGVFKSTDGGGSWTAMNAGFPRPIPVFTLVISSSGGCVHASTELGVFDFATQVDACPLPVAVADPLIGLGLTVTPHTVSAGASAQVDISMANAGPSALQDLYFLLLVPPALSAALGCPAGDAGVFLTNDLASAGVRCMNTAPPQTFPPLWSNVIIPAALRTTAIPHFYGFVWPDGLPPGGYTWVIFATPPGAFADGTSGLAEISAVGADSFESVP